MSEQQLSIIYTRKTDDPKVAESSSVPTNEFYSVAGSVIRKKLTTEISGKDELRDFYVANNLKGHGPACMGIREFLHNDSTQNFLVISGIYGIGKSTLLRYFEDYYVDKLLDKAFWVLFDGNGQKPVLIDPNSGYDEIVECILVSVKGFIQRTLLLTQANGQLLAIYEDVLDNDSYYDLNPGRKENEPDSDTRSQSLDAVKDQWNKKDIRSLVLHLQYISRYAGPLGAVLVIDNVEAILDVNQKLLFGIAKSLATSCKIKTILLAREATLASVAYHDPGSGALGLYYELEGPDMSTVFRKRIRQVFKDKSISSKAFGFGAMRSSIGSNTDLHEALLGILDPSPRNRILSLIKELSNGSIREAGAILDGMLSSHAMDLIRLVPEFNTERMDKTGRSLLTHVPYYLAIKALALTDRLVYDTEHTLLPNIFGSSSSQRQLHPLTRLYCLQYLNNHNDITVGQLLDGLNKAIPTMESHEFESSILSDLRWLIGKGLVQCVNYDDRLSHDMPLNSTSKGECYERTLSCEREYLSLIAPNVYMPEEYTNRIIAPANTLDERFENLLTLLEYLLDVELAYVRKLRTPMMRKAYTRHLRSHGIVAHIVTKCYEDFDTQSPPATIPSRKWGVHKDKLSLLFNTSVAEIRRTLSIGT